MSARHVATILGGVGVSKACDYYYYNDRPNCACRYNTLPLVAIVPFYSSASSCHVDRANRGLHQGSCAVSAFCTDQVACMVPAREAGLALGNRLNPMLLKACVQPVVA
jgi:hypothetical protein